MDQTPERKTLRVGVAGVGHIGSNHARLYAELSSVDFCAVYDIDAHRANAIARKYGVVPAGSLQEFASMVDAASIATPTSAHYPVAHALLSAGKHLLVEKPITENTKDASELAEIAARTQLILQVGHVERFNPVLSALETHLTRPRFIEAHRLSPYPDRSTDIGVVLDLMIHDLEIVLHLVRSPVVHIDAVGIPVLSRGEDIANARIRFENGCVANITSSRISPERMRKIRVFQEDAYLSLDYQNQSGEIYRKNNGRITRDKVEIERQEPLKRQLMAFIECATTGRQPAVSGFQATAALELAVNITKRLLPPQASQEMTEHSPRETIYFVAGEASGDNHGASLMNALRRLDPALRFSGRGGPQMQAIASGSFRNWIDRAAVVGLWEVIKNYSFFRREFRQTLNEIEALQPACVVLIDYPGFNLRLSRALSRKANRPRIIYYISPQVWAWNRGRIRHMARWLDLMLCIFPFEAELYNKSGLRTVFVGHPMHERLELQRTDSRRDPNLVALFPGSRQREVRKILPVMVEAAKLLREQNSALRFEIVAASPELESWIKLQLNALPNDQSKALQVTRGRAAAAMQDAWAGMVASGSATLEAAWFRLPFVLIYKVSWLTYLAGRMVIKVKHLGMPNVIAGRSVVPEFIQHEAKPKHMATTVLRLMTDSPARAQMLADFDQIVGSLGTGGASDRAAAAIINELKSLDQLAQAVRSTL